MKRFIPMVLFLFISVAGNALPLGNPADPTLLTKSVFLRKINSGCCTPFSFLRSNYSSFRFGYYGDFVCNRYFELSEHSPFGVGKKIKKTKLTTNAGYLDINFCDQLDVFSTLGATFIRVRTNDQSWTPFRNDIGTMETETKFSWSLGARSTLFQCYNFSLGVEGQYFQNHTKIKRYFLHDFVIPNYFHHDNKATYREWQLGGGLAYTFNQPCFTCVPYAGVKYSNAHFDTRNFKFNEINTDEIFTFFNTKSSKTWGYAVGITIVVCNSVEATFEGRFADEKAFHANCQFRF